MTKVELAKMLGLEMSQNYQDSGAVTISDIRRLLSDDPSEKVERAFANGNIWITYYVEHLEEIRDTLRKDYLRDDHNYLACKLEQKMWEKAAEIYLEGIKNAAISFLE